MRIIPVGYGNPKHRELIPVLMQDRRTALIDIKFAKAAAIPGWNSQALAKTYESQYHHIPAFGNKHYKTPELGIEIADLDDGLTALSSIWPGYTTLLILCGCGTMEATKQHPHGCHRRIVCDAIKRRWIQAEVVTPEQMLMQMHDERERLYQTLNGVAEKKVILADYWLLPEAQQRKVRMELSKR